MPLYEFSCSDCGAHFEALQSFSATTTPACPKCKGAEVTRLLSAPAIHFKGSGWYINDSKKSGKQSANGTSKSNGESSSEASSESAVESGSKTDGAGKKETSSESTATPAVAKSDSASGSTAKPNSVAA